MSEVNPPSADSEAERRALLFGITLSNIGRVVFRGMAAAGDGVSPDAIFKKGINWNYDNASTALSINPKLGIVRGAISTSKRPEPAMYYAAMAKGTDAAKKAWVYAIYCSKGVDYASEYINNPLTQKGGAFKDSSRAVFTRDEAGRRRIAMTPVGSGNQEIIMMNVERSEVLCARAVERDAAGMVWLEGKVVKNKRAALRSKNRQLFDMVVGVLSSYSKDDAFDFNACSPDRTWFGS